MKKISIDYTLQGSIDLHVPDVFEVSDEIIGALIREQNDRDLIGGIEHNGIEIDGDAIEIIRYEQEAEKR